MARLGYTSLYAELKCSVKLGFISGVDAKEVRPLFLSVENRFGRSIQLAWLVVFEYRASVI
jgi:hypothetical protein